MPAPIERALGDRLSPLRGGERVAVVSERTLERIRVELLLDLMTAPAVKAGAVTVDEMLRSMRLRAAPLFAFGVVARDVAWHASALATDPSRTVIVLVDGGERHVARGDLVRLDERDGMRRLDERSAAA